MVNKKARPKTLDEMRRGKAMLKAYLRYLFGLHEDSDLEAATKKITKGIEFRGANLWTLIFAILIASIGLNINSTAIIIGAMLISPLMGPIVGMGFGLGTNDFTLFKKAARNILVAVIIAILTSTIYFFLSPFKEAQSEILSRTNPTAFDVFIGILGGLTGIVAATRKEKSNSIPGVAIATALMPPLCTVGYGLATLQYKIAYGAFYLFVINGLFIAVATLAVTKYMRFKKVTYVDQKKARRVKFLISLIVILTIIPSVITVVNILHEGLFYRKVNSFLEKEFTFEDTAILMKKPKIFQDSSSLELTIFGKYLPEDSIAKLRGALKKYELADTKLTVLQQNSDPRKIDKATRSLRQEMLTMNQNIKTGILEDLYKKNEELIITKDSKIKFLEEELFKLKQESKVDSSAFIDDMKQLNILFPKIKGFTLSSNPIATVVKDSIVLDTVPRLYFYWHKKKWMSKKDIKKLERFMKSELDMDTLQFQYIR